MSLLSVTVKKARFVGGQAQHFNTYVTLKLQNVKSTTVTVKGANPCWEQDFLFETNDVNTGLLVEVWSKGMLWDRALGYHYIPLPDVSYSNEDGTGQWISLDSELEMRGGEVVGTKTPTGHALLIDCRFELPFDPENTEAADLQRKLELLNNIMDQEARAEQARRQILYTGHSGHSEDSDYTSDLNYPVGGQGANSSASQFRTAANQLATPQRSLETSRENSYEKDDHQIPAIVGSRLVAGRYGGGYGGRGHSPRYDEPYPEEGRPSRYATLHNAGESSEPLFYNSRPRHYKEYRRRKHTWDQDDSQDGWYGDGLQQDYQGTRTTGEGGIFNELDFLTGTTTSLTSKKRGPRRRPSLERQTTLYDEQPPYVQDAYGNNRHHEAMTDPRTRKLSATYPESFTDVNYHEYYDPVTSYAYQDERYGQDEEDRQWDSGGKWYPTGSTCYENTRNRRKNLPQRPASSIGIHRPEYRPTVTRQRSYDSEELDYSGPTSRRRKTIQPQRRSASRQEGTGKKLPPTPTKPSSVIVGKVKPASLPATPGRQLPRTRTPSEDGYYKSDYNEDYNYAYQSQDNLPQDSYTDNVYRDTYHQGSYPAASFGQSYTTSYTDAYGTPTSTTITTSTTGMTIQGSYDSRTDTTYYESGRTRSGYKMDYEGGQTYEQQTTLPAYEEPYQPDSYGMVDPSRTYGQNLHDRYDNSRLPTTDTYQESSTSKDNIDPRYQQDQTTIEDYSQEAYIGNYDGRQYNVPTTVNCDQTKQGNYQDNSFDQNNSSATLEQGRYQESYEQNNYQDQFSDEYGTRYEVPTSGPYVDEYRAISCNEKSVAVSQGQRNEGYDQRVDPYAKTYEGYTDDEYGAKKPNSYGQDAYKDEYQNRETYEDGYRDESAYKDGYEDQAVYEDGYETRETYDDGYRMQDSYENQETYKDVYDEQDSYKNDYQTRNEDEDAYQNQDHADRNHGPYANSYGGSFDKYNGSEVSETGRRQSEVPELSVTTPRGQTRSNGYPSSESEYFYPCQDSEDVSPLGSSRRKKLSKRESSPLQQQNTDSLESRDDELKESFETAVSSVSSSQPRMGYSEYSTAGESTPAPPNYADLPQSQNHSPAQSQDLPIVTNHSAGAGTGQANGSMVTSAVVHAATTTTTTANGKRLARTDSYQPEMIEDEYQDSMPAEPRRKDSQMSHQSQASQLSVQSQKPRLTRGESYVSSDHLSRDDSYDNLSRKDSYAQSSRRDSYGSVTQDSYKSSLNRTDSYQPRELTRGNSFAQNFNAPQPISRAESCKRGYFKQQDSLEETDIVLSNTVNGEYKMREETLERYQRGEEALIRSSRENSLVEPYKGTPPRSHSISPQGSVTKQVSLDESVQMDTPPRSPPEPPRDEELLEIVGVVPVPTQLKERTEMTPRQRWHWAYNKIIMQLNVSNYYTLALLLSAQHFQFLNRVPSPVSFHRFRFRRSDLLRSLFLFLFFSPFFVHNFSIFFPFLRNVHRREDPVAWIDALNIVNSVTFTRIARLAVIVNTNKRF